MSIVYDVRTVLILLCYAMYSHHDLRIESTVSAYLRRRQCRFASPHALLVSIAFPLQSHKFENNAVIVPFSSVKDVSRGMFPSSSSTTS